MTLSRNILLKNAALLVCLLLVGAASVWGLYRLRADVNAAAAGMAELIAMQDITARAAAVEDRFEGAAPPFDAAHVELLGLREDLNHFVAEKSRVGRTPRTGDDVELRIARNAAALVNQIEADLAGPKPDRTRQSARLDKLIHDASAIARSSGREVQARHNASEHELRVTMLLMGGLSFITVAVVGVIGVQLYRAIVRPVLTLRRATHQVAAGRFGYRVTIVGDAEFVELASDFNRMAAQLDDFYRLLEEKVASKSRELVRSQRLASVGFLAAGVAHEINTPLNVISGYAELSLKRLGSPGYNEEQRAERRAELAAALRLIRDEAFRCTEITQRLLAMSRTGGDQRAVLLLADVVDETVMIVSGLPRFSGRAVTVNHAHPDDTAVFASQSEMKQVTLNLVANALDALPEQGGEVKLDVTRAGDDIVLSVTDNGRGMTADVIDSVFEPFFTQKRGGQTPGTGLGLSITHAIVEAHGGTIVAHSAGLNQGSRFVVRLPAHAQELLV